MLFVAGVIVLPAVHDMEINHCRSGEHPESHSPENCAVCAVAAASMISVCPHVVVAVEAGPVRMITFSEIVPNCLVIIDNHMARAPPFA